MAIEDRLRSAATELREATRVAVVPERKAHPPRMVLAAVAAAVLALVGATLWLTAGSSGPVSVSTGGSVTPNNHGRGGSSLPTTSFPSVSDGHSGAGAFYQDTITSSAVWKGATYAAGWVGAKDCGSRELASCAARAAVWVDTGPSWSQVWISPPVGQLGVPGPGPLSLIGPNNATASVSLVPTANRLYLFSSVGMLMQPPDTEEWESTDGAEWTKVNLPVAMNRSYLVSVASGDGKLVLAESSPTPGSQTTVWTSSNGDSWQSTSPSVANMTAVASCLAATTNGFLLAGRFNDPVDRPAVWASQHGQTWQPTQLTDLHGYVDGLATRGSTAVAVTEMSDGATSARSIFVTQDDHTWSQAHLDGNLTATGGVLDVLAGPDGFVLVLFGTTSAPVTVWSSNPAGTQWHPDTLIGAPRSFQADGAQLNGPGRLLLFGSSSNSGDQPTTVTFTPYSQPKP